MDFSLERCRDQFCFECFYQYILALSQQQQWQYGGCVTRPQVKCPVCSDPLQKHEWSCYLVRTRESVDLRRLYESTAAERFKSVSRHCPECMGECAIVVNVGGNKYLHNDGVKNRKQLLELLFDKLLLRLKEDDPFLDEYEEFMKSQGLSNSRQDRRNSNNSNGGGEADMSVDEEEESEEEEEDNNHHYDSFSSSRFRIPLMYERMKQALEERSCLADVVLKSSNSSTTPAMDIVTDPAANPGLLSLPSPADSAIAVSPSSIVQTVKRRRFLHRLQTSEAEKQLYCLATSDYNNYDVGCILKLLVSLETDLANWYKLVFALLKDYYRVKCEKCGCQFCFRCGLTGWHSGMTCSVNMKKIIDEKMQIGEKDEKLGNLKWVYEHGKQCPRCYTVITRDEGCNKVDCTICSFKFCWICCNEWSDKCGYFRCKTNSNTASPQSGLETKDKINTNSTVANKDENNSDKPNVDALPEIGVPNVKAIMQRIGPSH